MSHTQNIARIKAVYNALGDLKDKVVFVGGATVSLYADREAPQIRPTDDVDIVVEISSRSAYAVLEQQLRNMGFRNDVTANFLGRYLLPGVIVDVMPTDETILGFSNRWYAEGFKTALFYKIDKQHQVKIFTPPFFIASKLEAFKNRGGNDGRTSSDFEDIVFVLENRTVIWQEVAAAPKPLIFYLRKEFGELLKNPYCQEWLSAHSNVYPPSSYYIMKDMKAFVEL